MPSLVVALGHTHFRTEGACVRTAFEYVLEPDWPPLSWIARCVKNDPTIRVRHGKQVETHADWFCEAIWDGTFESGAFDQTDTVFGSGGRLRAREAIFVSSASTEDRLHVLRRTDDVLISNSLPCLLSAAQTRIPPSAEDWFALFISIRHGINRYRRHIPTTSGDRVELVYFRNLQWTGTDFIEVDKPTLLRDFSTYDKYFGFLVDAATRLSANFSDEARRYRYEFLGTLSSGYDCNAATVVCSRAGLTQAITSGRPRGAGADDGMAVAQALNLEVVKFDRDAWRQRPRAEVVFFAGTPRGGEVYLSAVEERLAGKVLVTGFTGDSTWGKATTALGADLVRGGMSGLSLCEYRLHIGFIHFPLAFLGVRQIRDINAISNSKALAQWDVPGDYSRPICRRILEDAGVPRDAFGQRKKMANIHFGQGETMLTEASKRDYHGWLTSGWRSGQFPVLRRSPAPGVLTMWLGDHWWLLDRTVHFAARAFPESVRKAASRRLSRMQRGLSRRINVPDFVFPWAVDRTRDAYGRSGDRRANAVDRS